MSTLPQVPAGTVQVATDSCWANKLASTSTALCAGLTSPQLTNPLEQHLHGGTARAALVQGGLEQ